MGVIATTTPNGLRNGEPNFVESRSCVGVEWEGVAITVGAFESREPDDFARSRSFSPGFANTFAHFVADNPS